MGLKTYDSKQVSVIVGTKPMSGFAEGTFVAVERDDQAYTKVVGADGEVTRSKTNNKAGTVTITLKQSSDSNDFLSGLELAGTVVPLMVRDASGRSLIVCESAWVQKLPVVEFGKEAGDRVWVFDCGDLNILVAGN